jgi:hypothetical protein
MTPSNEAHGLCLLRVEASQLNCGDSDHERRYRTAVKLRRIVCHIKGVLPMLMRGVRIFHADSKGSARAVAPAAVNLVRAAIGRAKVPSVIRVLQPFFVGAGFCTFNGVVPVRSCVTMLASLLLTLSYIRRFSGGVPNRYDYMQACLDSALLYVQHGCLSGAGSTPDFLPLTRRMLCQLFRSPPSSNIGPTGA